MNRIMFKMVFLLSFINSVSKAYLIDGYTDKPSYRPGETVKFYTRADHNGGVETYTLKTINGALSSYNITGFIQTTQSGQNTVEPWKNGFDYTLTATWTVPSGIKSGVYLLSASDPIGIIIKNANYPSMADIVVVCPTNTDQAYMRDVYNGPGAYDPVTKTGISSIGLYAADKDPRDRFPDGHLFYSPIVSFNRPITRLRTEDAFLIWLNTQSYSVSVISDRDMEDYNEIKNAKVLIVPGHSEYWTKEAREHFDQFVADQSGHSRDAMILSGNSMWWQIRLQEDPNNSNNQQMVCFRGANGRSDGYYDDNQTCDPLLETNEWYHPSKRNSILGGIGESWAEAFYTPGGFGNTVKCNGGYSGFKIIAPQSPLLIGTSISGPYLHLTTGEFDGTLVKRDGSYNAILDGNGDPILDKEALGFYKAEMIGYDQTYSDDNLERLRYCALMAFQKTCNSGRIINAASNYWCGDYGIGGYALDDKCSGQAVNGDAANIKIITKNMIDLLLSESEIFSSNISSDGITIKPSFVNIGYTACANGTINITPCGVVLSDASKVDNIIPYEFSAKIIDCTSCNRGARIALKPKSKDKEDTKITPIEPQFNIAPNPNNGSFNLVFNQPLTGTLIVSNLMGEVIQKINLENRENILVEIDSKIAGIYNLSIFSGQKILQKKCVIYNNN